VFVILNGKALIRALVEVPAANALAMQMPAADVRSGQPLHKGSEVTVSSRPHKHVPVIRHDAVRQKADRHALDRLGNHLL
jgi:hypothetical protein